jgi:hypothetical protein
MGADFSRVLMVGRQRFYPDTAVLEQIGNVLGRRADAQVASADFSEPFLKWLGAGKISSLDISSFEGADIIHDLNDPIPASLTQKFSLVFDGGTLEHIFNVPTAFKNCMEMIEVGGHFIQVNVANNFAGHGFWQFSPELLFRMFSKENGFQVRAALVYEIEPNGKWYAVADPDLCKQRVEFRNILRTYICVIAQRTVVTEIFRQFPQQSDYVATWAGQLAQWTPTVELNSLSEPQFCRVEDFDLLRGLVANGKVG